MECDAVEGLIKIPSKTVSLILTSPPYDSLRDYKNKKEFNFKDICLQAERVLVKGGMLVWIVNDQYEKGSRTLTSFKHAIFMKEVCGFDIHDVMIYEKHNFSNPSRNRYHQIYEYMICASKGKPKTFNPIKDKPNKYAGSKVWGKNTVKQKDGSRKERPAKMYAEFGMRSNIWRVKTYVHNADGKLASKHPAPFPLTLAEDHIRTWTNEGDLVVDPLMGSGTTLIAADKLNRKYIGIDDNPEWIKIAKERFKIN